ncbi:MAG TPA: LLM class flavin-dependent oxidoreductase, partial [Bordetella sp.]
VRRAEQAKFDLVFFADTPDTSADLHPGMMVRLEPLVLLGALSMVTSRLGLVATVSTTYSQPYNVARAFASLDRMSGGRIGWNVVTGSSPNAAYNFGNEHHPDHGSRYEMATEYLKVAKGLWDSWEDDALVADKATGVYMDTTKMHTLNHEGKYYQVKGPLNASRPPQGYPVIFQAGASDTGKDFAAATAEVVFATQSILEDAVAFAKDLKDRVEKAGRSRDSLKIMLGVAPMVGDSYEDAQRKVAELARLVKPEVALKTLSDRLGHDMSKFPLDEPLPELPQSTMMQGHAVVLKSIAKKYNMTLRQLLDYAAVSSGHRLLMGTAEQVADDLQLWFEAGAADGFVVLPSFYPTPFDRFVDEVVPILAERGVFRKEYAGSTLREHLGLERPAHPLTLGR